MSALQFRNLDVTPDDPVEEWGTEGILAAIDRGGIEDWQKIQHALETHPNGTVADSVEEALTVAESEGARAYIAHCLADARMNDKVRFARTFRTWVRESGLSRTELAEYLGTSRSRLSTYESGQVTPSAVIAEKVRQLGMQRRAHLVA